MPAYNCRKISPAVRGNYFASMCNFFWFLVNNCCLPNFFYAFSAQKGTQMVKEEAVSALTTVAEALSVCF